MQIVKKLNSVRKDKNPLNTASIEHKQTNNYYIFIQLCWKLYHTCRCVCGEISTLYI
jgi:hypothetical protein